MDWMNSVTEWHEVLPEFPDEEYPHTSQEYREWISGEDTWVDGFGNPTDPPEQIGSEHR